MKDNSYVFLILGNKGFYTSDGTKIYFPDRKSNEGLELHEGIYKCKVVKELDKYGFIKLEEVKTSSLEDAVKVGLVSINTVKYLCSIGGDTYYWIDENNKYFAMVGDELVEMSSFSENSFYISNWLQSLSYRCSSRRDLDRKLSGIRVKYFGNYLDGYSSSSSLSNNELMELAIHSLCDVYYGDNFPKIYSYKDCAIVLKLSYSITNENCFYIRTKDEYLYCEEHSTVDVCISEVLDVSSLVEITDDVKTLIKDYSIALGKGNFTSESGIVVNSISFMGESIDVKFVNGKYFTFDSYNRIYKNKVEESKQQFDEFKKSLGKYVNKNNLSEFKKLSTLNWQLGTS